MLQVNSNHYSTPVKAALEEEKRQKGQVSSKAQKKRLYSYQTTAPTVSQDKDEECRVWGDIQLILAWGSVGAVSLLSSLFP